MISPKHPVNEGAASMWHAAFFVMYLVAAAFHGASALAHWRDR